MLLQLGKSRGKNPRFPTLWWCSCETILDIFPAVFPDSTGCICVMHAEHCNERTYDWNMRVRGEHLGRTKSSCTGWFPVPLIYCTTNLLDHWFTKPLFCWAIDPLDLYNHWPAASLFCWATDLLDHWDHCSPEPLICWTTDLLDHCSVEHQYAGPLLCHWLSAQDLLDHWFAQSLACWTNVLLDNWPVWLLTSCTTVLLHHLLPGVFSVISWTYDLLYHWPAGSLTCWINNSAVFTFSIKKSFMDLQPKSNTLHTSKLKHVCVCLKKAGRCFAAKPQM